MDYEVNGETLTWNARAAYYGVGSLWLIQKMNSGPNLQFLFDFSLPKAKNAKLQVPDGWSIRSGLEKKSKVLNIHFQPFRYISGICMCLTVFYSKSPWFSKIEDTRCHAINWVEPLMQTKSINVQSDVNQFQTLK